MGLAQGKSGRGVRGVREKRDAFLLAGFPFDIILLHSMEFCKWAKNGLGKTPHPHSPPISTKEGRRKNGSEGA